MIDKKVNSITSSKKNQSEINLDNIEMPDTETKSDDGKTKKKKQKKPIKHPHWRKFGKVMLWLIIIFSALGGAGYYAFSSGWVEKECTKITIPFQWFVGNEHIQNVNNEEVQPMNNVNIEDYKNQLQNFCKYFNLNNTKRPDLDNFNLSESAKDTLNHKFNAIYGVPHTYIANMSVTGICGTKNGWGPLVSFAVVNDTKTITTYNFQFLLNNGKVTKAYYINSSENLYWHSEIPNNYNFSNITAAQNLVNNLFENNNLNNNSIQLSDKVKSLKTYYKNGVISRIIATTDPNQIEIQYTIGTDKAKVKVNAIFDTASNTIKSVQ